MGERIIVQHRQGHDSLPDGCRGGVKEGVFLCQTVFQQPGYQFAPELQEEIEPIGHSLEGVLPRFRQ